MTAPQVILIGAVIIIGYIENRFKFMEKLNYYWIQDDGPHCFSRHSKARHHRERTFKYFMLMSYGAQYDRGLRMH